MDGAEDKVRSYNIDEAIDDGGGAQGTCTFVSSSSSSAAEIVGPV